GRDTLKSTVSRPFVHGDGFLCQAREGEVQNVMIPIVVRCDHRVPFVHIELYRFCVDAFLQTLLKAVFIEDVTGGVGTRRCGNTELNTRPELPDPVGPSTALSVIKPT